MRETAGRIIVESVHLKVRGKRYPKTVVVLASASKYRVEAKAFIEAIGYEVKATDNVFDAMRLAQMEYGLCPVILVTEHILKGVVNLPLYTGVDLIRHLKGRKMFPLVSIFVHYKDDDDLFAKAREAGAFQCFSKRMRGSFPYNLGKEFRQVFSSSEDQLRLKMQSILDSRASDMDNDVLVYNEIGAKERWEHTWRHAKENKKVQLPSCINFDLAGFRQANEECHEDGNRLIREIAHVVCLHIRPTDYLFRDCGDKFLLFLPETSHKDAQDTSDRLKRELEAMTFELSSGKPVSFSFRDAVVSCLPEDLGLSGEKVYARITNEADRLERSKKKLAK